MDTFVKQLGPTLTPEIVGAAVVRIATGQESLGTKRAYRLAGDGLQPVG